MISPIGRTDKPLKILTWAIQGSYLNALTHVPHQWYQPVKPGSPPGFGGIDGVLRRRDHVRDVPAGEVCNLDLDVIVFQHARNYQDDQIEILSPEQRRLPRVYVEHNVPQPHAVESRHPMDDPQVLVVHVTHFNRLMWDNGDVPTVVIEHSVAIDPEARYSGQLERGITVVNSMPRRGRAVGLDLFQQARTRVPLDLAGMENGSLRPIGDIAYPELHRRVAEYRFLYSPIRYTSLPLAVIEALHIGMPVVALATTELPSVIVDDVSGYVSPDPEVLIDRMRSLLDDPTEARRLGDNARALAQQRFGLDRYIEDWNYVLALVTA